jgi:hypothetical protein
MGAVVARGRHCVVDVRSTVGDASVAARAFWITTAALLGIYLATLAPTVTLWDAGEFLSAVHGLGIPHPPGTPLFVFVANAWAQLFGFLPFAAVVNAASAVAAAVGCASFAWLVTRWTASATSGVLAGLVAGSMSTLWQSATETEVYSYSLALVALMLVVGELAGTRWSRRHRLLLAFLFGLAVPLHLSALVAGAAAILLASTDAGGSLSLRAAVVPAGAWLLAVGIGTVSAFPMVAGITICAIGTLVPQDEPGRGRLTQALGSVALTILGASFIAVMLLRALHDPPVNQGNPSTWSALVEVVGRRQYDVPPLWPRRAPLWLQAGNVVQYADWQIGSGLSDAPGPSWWRTPFTLLFVVLGIVGAMAHRQIDRRSWRAMGVLFLAASLGVVVVLNLRAGPSFGWGVLADSARREARERDYFFALAFAVWGVWAGIGLGALARRARSRARAIALLSFGVLPVLLNWRAVDRRRIPDAVLADLLGRSLLASAPPNAVLVLEGDNDSYSTWYAQRASSLRRDVVAVTIPLLGADWYRAELGRRYGILDAASIARWQGQEATLAAIARGAERAGRPLGVAVSVTPPERSAMGAWWHLEGLVFVRQSTMRESSPLTIDLQKTAAVARLVEVAGVTFSTPAAKDGTGRYVQRLLLCPAAAVALRRGDEGRSGLLETTCNFR